MQAWILAEADGIIVAAHCNCKAGLGEACTHIASILFYIDIKVKLRNSKTVTEEKAYWLMPSAYKSVEYKPANEVNFMNPAAHRKVLEEMISMDESEFESSQQQPRPKATQVPSPSESEISCFLKEIHNSQANSVILALNEPYSDAFIPKSSNVNLPKPLTELFSKEAMKMDEEDLRMHCSEINLSMTSDEANLIEEVTREQAQSKLWFNYRAGRITASKMKSACCTDVDNPSASLIKDICNPSSSNFKSVAMSWGSNHEQVARDDFIKLLKPSHVNFSVETKGLVINPSYPFIGASPDGIVKCDCCGERILEIKCPYKMKDKDLKVEHSNFYLKKKEDGKMKLERSHEYFYQVQTQLGVCQLEEAFFVVWNTTGIHIEIIKFDRDNWTYMLTKADNLYKKVIVLEIVGRYFSLRKHKSSISETASKGIKICYSNSNDSDEYSVIICSGKHCEIKYFHNACIFFEEKIMGKTKWKCYDCKGK